MARQINTNLPDYAKQAAYNQAMRISAENGEFAYGGIHYLNNEDARRADDYNTALRMQRFYDDVSSLRYLSQEDEEKRRRHIEALRNDPAITSRSYKYNDLLDYGEAQVNQASRYRSYDEWGQQTGDKTYIGQLQSQLNNLQSQLDSLQGQNVNLMKLGWANLTKNANLNGQNPNDKLDLTSLGLKKIFGRDDKSTESRIADIQAQMDTANAKLKNAALNAPSDIYARFDAMSNEELASAREQLEKEYAKDVEENPWKHLTNEQAMQITQGGGASGLMKEAKTMPNEIRYIDKLLETRKRQAIYEEYAKKIGEEGFDGDYDTNIDDIEYRLINDDLSGLEYAGASQYMLGNPVNQMTDEERRIYNSVYKNEGKEAASEFLSFLEKDLNFRQRIEDEAAAREYAQESPVGASFLSVISRLASPVEAVTQATHLAMGDYDENAYYNSASRFTQNVRDQVSKDIRMDSGELGAWIYNTGMSVADNLAQMGLGGGAGTLMMMGTAVFSDSLVQGRDAGLSDSEIIADATVRAAIEIATERIGLDEVMKVVKGSGGVQVLRAMFAEGGEEGLSNLGNLYYDSIKATIMGNESEIREDVKKLMAVGYSESEAAAIVIGNKAKDLGIDVLAGMVSGLALSGGSYVGSISLEKAAHYAKQTFDGAVERGLSLGDGSDAYKMAEQNAKNEPQMNRMAKEVAKISQIRANDKATVKLLKDSVQSIKQELESVDIDKLPDKIEEIGNRIVMESKGATQEASTEIRTDEEGNETSVETKEKSDLGKKEIQLAALGIARAQIFEKKLRDETLKTNATTMEGNVSQADKILRMGLQPTIQLSNGEIVNLENLNFNGDGALQTAYNNAVVGLKRTSDANTYIADYKYLNNLVSAEFFDTLWKTAYKMYSGTVENVKNNSAVANVLNAYKNIIGFNMNAIDTVIQHAQKAGAESAIRITEASKTLVREMAALTNQKVEFVDNLVDADGNTVQGLYDKDTKTIKISTTTRNPATVVFCHELTHAMQDASPEVYKLYKKVVLDKLSKSEANYIFVEDQVKKAYGENVSQEEIEDEIVAIASENFLVESAFVNQLKKNRNLFRKVRNVILNRYQRVGMDIVRNRMNDMEKEDYDWFKKLTSLWVDMATQADLDEAALEQYEKDLFEDTKPNGELTEEAMENVKEKVDNQEMVTPQAESQFSREFDGDFMDFADAKNIMSDSEYKKYKQIRKSKGNAEAQKYFDEVKEKLKANLKKAARESLVDEATMQKAREVRANTRQLLEQFKRFLPEDKMGKDWKTKNGSYDISGDLGTVCVRSLAVEPLMDFIADKIGHPLTAEETTYISQELMNYTHVPPCVYCYVAMDRNAKRDFLNAFINWRENTISNFRSGMSEDDVKKAFLKYNYKSGSRTMNDKLKARFNLWKKMAFDPNYEKITKADLTSVERMEERSKVSASFAEQIKDAQDYAQSASYAKGVIGYTAYNNEILNWSAKRVKALNAQYGMRMYSFTDYHPAFVLENMQMITDAAVKGLKVLAYTKEIDFAKIFMRTGANINISIFAQNKFVDGTYHQDGMMGADWALAKQAREDSNKFGGNVGITMVAINDEQVEWACKQDWIDVVIPFHTVKAEQFADLNKWQNFKGVQEEKKLTKADADYWAEDKEWTPGEWVKGMKKEIMPQDHGNDYDTYIQACKANHLKPKFEKWYEKWGKNGDATTRAWYMKLVVETRRSYNETDPVQPLFDVKDFESEEEFLEKSAIAESIRRMNKPWDAPIGETAEGHEDITLDEIAKSISDKMKTQTFSDGRLSRDFEDVGYHAGDLGKSEALSSQSGSRDTGHFGTGTYFVGNEERIRGYNSRDGKPAPVERVDFSGYNLFKPKNYSEANKLHQFMRRVDGWIGQYDGARSEAEYNDYKEQLSDANYEFYENGQQEAIDDIDSYFFSDIESEERRSDAEIIDDVVRLARLTLGDRTLAQTIAEHSNGEVYASGGTLIVDDGIYETEYTPEEYLKRIPRETAENIMDWVDTEVGNWRSGGLERAMRYEDWHDSFDEVADILGVSSDTLENAIAEATREANEINYPESTTEDSIATRVMKKLGYEGVDVRHINDMDNTTYGSVIYDLKGDALTRKQEIGTARFSLEIKYQNGTTDSISNLREVTDEQIETYVKAAANKELYEQSYIPIGRNTPKVLIDSLNNADVTELSDIKIIDYPMIMQVTKLRQALASRATRKNKKPHKLTYKELLKAINDLNEPIEIILQTNREDKDGNPLPDNVAVLVKLADYLDGLAIIEFDTKIKKEFGGERKKQTFNTVVTVFVPNNQYYNDLVDNPNNVVIPIIKEDTSPNPITRDTHMDSEELPLSDNTVTREGEERNPNSLEFVSEEGTGSVDSEYIDKTADILKDVDLSKVRLKDYQIEKIAKKLIRDAKSEYPVEELTANLKTAFAFWTQNKGTNYAALTRIMSEYMMPVIESVYDYSGDQMRRNSLKGKTFIVSEEAAKKADLKGMRQRFLYLGVSFTTNQNFTSEKREVVKLKDSWYNESNADGIAMDLGIDTSITDEAEMLKELDRFVSSERTESAVQMIAPEMREHAAYDLTLDAFQEFINESRVSLKDVNERVKQDARIVISERVDKKVAKLREDYQQKYLDLLDKNKNELRKKKDSLQEKADKAHQLERLEREWKRFEKYVKSPNKGRHFAPSFMKYLEDFADMIDLTGKRPSKKNIRLTEMADEYRRIAKLEVYEDRQYDETIEMAIREVDEMIAGRPMRDLNSKELKQVVDVVRAFIKKASSRDEFTQKNLGESVQEAARQTIDHIDKSRGLTNKDSVMDKWLETSLSPMRAIARLTDFHDNDPLYKAADSIIRGEIKVNQYKMEMAMIFKEMQPNQYDRGSEERKRAREYRKRYDNMNNKYVKVRLGGKDIEITEAQRLELIMHSRSEDNMRHILFGGVLVPDMNQLKKGNWKTAYTNGTIIRPFEHEIYKLTNNLDEFEQWFLDRSTKYFDYASRLINQTSLELEGFARADVENYYPIRVAENYTKQKSYDVLTGLADTGESIDSAMLKSRVKSKLPIYLNGINQSLQRHQNFASRYAGLAIPLADFERIYFGQVREDAPSFLYDLKGAIYQMKGKTLTKSDIVEDIKKKMYTVNDAEGNYVSGDLKEAILKAGDYKRGTTVEYKGNTYTIVDNVDEAIKWTQLDEFLQSYGKFIEKQVVIDYLNNKGLTRVNPVREVIEAKWGHHATKYIGNALDDLIGKRHIEQTVLDKVRGNAAQAILTLNPSVSIKQAASFPTAIAELGYRSVSKALFVGGKHNWMFSRADQELINKYTGVLWGRMQGMTTQEMAELSTNQNKTVVNKALDAVPWLTNWIQKMDVATVGRLWYATQNWIDSKYKEQIASGRLVKGSDAYYEKVARKFEDVVTKTQPNYSVFTRPDILRNKNGLVKAVMMFKTQPLQNFNIMYESVARLNAKIRQYNQEKSVHAKAELNAAWAKMGRALTSQVLQTAVFTGMTFLANALLLHRWDKYKDEDINEVTVASVLEGLMWDYISSFMGNAFIGDWVEGVGEYFVRRAMGEDDAQLRGISVFGIDTLNDLYDLVDRIADSAIKGEEVSAWKNVVKFAENISTIFGIPAGNIVKVFQSGWMYGQDIFDGEDLPITNLEREGIPVLFDFPETNVTQYWNRVIRAYDEGDYKLVKERFDDMIESTTYTETDKNGKEKTKIKAIGALSTSDTKGIMEWVANKYVNGTYTEKQMVEGWLEKLYQYSGDPESSIWSAKRRFYEFLEDEDKMPMELKKDEELTQAELEIRKEQRKEEDKQKKIEIVKTNIPEMQSAIDSWSSGRGYSLPMEKGDTGISDVLAYIYQTTSNKEAVKRFAVDVLGYKADHINSTAKDWAKKDLSAYK